MTSFSASNDWLQKFKVAYGICEMLIRDEADNIPRMTIQSWIDCLPNLTTVCELKSIWKMDELELFLKTLPERSLAQKLRSCKGCERSKQRFTAAFFAAADSSKVLGPVVIWESKSPKCFKNTQNKFRPSMVHYVSNNKVWMETEIMENVLRHLLIKNYV